ncbi:PREDICTED: heat shock 22 kDa protein, mitochondrial isoform X2 [Fragaria vesca subsp. vesca]|uniref:heat shock 22 kDa protein, mitochondrial isoform X2 n=1 Tax=Fragaria vesca subsp. vesca TaxID=101020 RepID=UPI0002C2DD24|nr:PREDICTED: heat shock 22 kDa protein, mitochondrial isoform X2 [Fragaria vesca subsp. vesca]
MASSISIALRRASSSPSLFSKLFNPLRSVSVAPSVSRSFNTNAQRSSYDDDDRSVSVDRSTSGSPYRRRDPIDVFDPFYDESRSIARSLNQVPRSLSQVLNLMDQFMENPYLAAYRGLGAGGSRRGWDVKETEDSLLLRMDMPGLNKEDVKISVEQGTLTVKGEGKDPEGEEDGGRRFSTRLDLPAKIYELNSIKAEMKNGVLKLVVPKVKEEEKKNVFEVKIE